MYKLISCTDKQGVEKVEFMNELKEKHPNMMGDVIYYDVFISGYNNGLNPCFCLLWNDDSNKMLRTSRVKNFYEADGEMVVTTMNSVYTFIHNGE